MSLSLSLRTFSSFTLKLHPHTAPRGAPLAQCSCDCLYSRKIKKCEFEFECEDIFFLHTQSTPSHCPPWCASGAMILEESNSSKIKKCECEFGCEDIFFLHTQSPHSHCPPWCASGAMILGQSKFKENKKV